MTSFVAQPRLCFKTLPAGGWLGVGCAFGLALWATPTPAQTFATLPSRAADQPGFVYTASPADWRDVPIYQVMTDRFFDGDSANNDDNPYGDTNPAGERSIHGGDFEGLQAKLDYIRMLGGRAVWISPVVRNVNGEFHGYAATDFNAIDPHWGTLAELRALVDAAHARGMYVIIDVVQNHTGDRITSSSSGWPSFNTNGYTLRWINTARKHAPPFDTLTRFYNYGQIDDWNDPVQSLKGDFFSLDGINTEQPAVRQDMITIFQALIAATDCDGFRVDTARHIEMGFWEAFLPALESYCGSIGKTNFLIFAEAWLGDDADLAPFTATNRFNSVLYFPLRDTMEGVFVWGNPTAGITDRLNQLPLYNARARDQMVQFLDNHDMPRYLSTDKLSGNTALAQAALSFLYTSGRVPCLYYGTEQGFNGGGDPDDREDMFDGQFEFGPSDGDNFDMAAPLFQHVRTLCLLRQVHPVLRKGTWGPQLQTTGGRGLYVYSMLWNGAEAVVAINTASQSQLAESGGLGPATTQPAGTVMANLFDPTETVTVGQGGGPSRITFSIPAYGTKIWVPQSHVVPLPPSVRAMAPAHHATDVARGERIVLTFDQPMNLASVESTFTVVPSVPGTFVWDSPSQVNFVPSSLLNGVTRYTVRVGASAAGTNGQALGIGFESFFTTGTNTIPVKEVPLRQYQLDGQLSTVEAATLRASTNGVALYADFNGKLLYFATPAADYPEDRFLFVTTTTNGSSSAPWAKNGTVAGLQHYVGNEADNGWSGWFHATSGSGGQSASVQGGWLEGTLDPLTAFGSIPPRLFVASAPYETPDGGDMVPGGQCPGGDGDGNLEAREYYVLNLAAFDTDGDGLADLQEDANANGVFDAGETRTLVVDTDDDGMSDGQEYQAGTNPNDPQSLFVSDIQHVQGAGQVAVRWMGLSGHAYTVWAANQASGPWTPTAMQNVSGAGVTLEYAEASATGQPARLFRVQVWRLP
ncbi:MAG: alpha-amylase family glycosyl hydrolase [Verrucomicrobia bacterium]|jgi:glycosidase|nr:alpha-amylase family glycosyl hydrolase [Verrucomicrobiota bacterium]